nr:hypothetical protein BaRGS_015998 [Batillaria attramentaria]
MSGISENGTYQLEETTEEGGEEEEDDVLTEMHQEVFHIHMKQTDSSNGGGNLLGTSSSDPTFAGRRDVRDPGSLHERKIVSAKGTVRGFKNRVRAGIATFLLDLPSSKVGMT